MKFYLLITFFALSHTAFAQITTLPDDDETLTDSTSRRPTQNRQSLPKHATIRQRAEPETAKNKPAEDPPTLSLRDRLYYGGNFGLGFSNGWIVEFSPLIGYKFNQPFSVGGGIISEYASAQLEDAGTRYHYKSFSYGARAFARYKIWEDIFVHVEYSVINYEVPDYESLGVLQVLPDKSIKMRRTTLPGLLPGVGYKSGGQLSFNLMLLYDLLYTRVNPNYSPLNMRMGLEYNF